MVVHHFDQQRALHRTHTRAEGLVGRRGIGRTVHDLIARLLSRSRFVSHRPSIHSQRTAHTARIARTEAEIAEVGGILRIGHRSRIHITIGIQAFVFGNEEREAALHRLQIGREILLQRSAAIIRSLDVGVVRTHHGAHHLRIAVVERGGDHGCIVGGRDDAVHHINHTVVGHERFGEHRFVGRF